MLKTLTHMPAVEPQPLHTPDPLLAVLSLHRARQYVAGIPAAVSGQGGHKQTLSVALALIHGFALPAADALPILEAYNARCDPPWTAAELQRKLTSAARFATAQARAKPGLIPLLRPRGHLLTGNHSLRIIRPNTAVPARHKEPSLGTIRLLDADLAAEPPAPPAKHGHLGVESSAFDVERLPDPSDAGSTIPGSPPPVDARPGPTIQLPRAGEGIIDPRTDPQTEWIHIQGYMSVPPKNCLVCWITRSRSLWIGMCLCCKKMQPDPNGAKLSEVWERIRCRFFDEAGVPFCDEAWSRGDNFWGGVFGLLVQFDRGEEEEDPGRSPGAFLR
jgi:hypothetical protein